MSGIAGGTRVISLRLLSASCGDDIKTDNANAAATTDIYTTTVPRKNLEVLPLRRCDVDTTSFSNTVVSFCVILITRVRHPEHDPDSTEKALTLFGKCAQKRGRNLTSPVCRRTRLSGDGVIFL